MCSHGWLCIVRRAAGLPDLRQCVGDHQPCCDRLFPSIPEIPLDDRRLTLPVRFCVVPSDSSAAIASIAQQFAAMDPNGRAVVTPDDPAYPAAVVAQAIAGVDDPGAVVLTRSGEVFDVLDVDDAQNGGIIDLTFAEAFLA